MLSMTSSSTCKQKAVQNIIIGCYFNGLASCTWSYVIGRKQAHTIQFQYTC